MSDLFKISEAFVRRVDERLTIFEIFNGNNFSFDLVKAELHGGHPKVLNKVSDRVYYVLSGYGEALVGGENSKISPGDVVRIPRGAVHSISGDLEYLIVTSPPFDPNNEEIIPE